MPSGNGRKTDRPSYARTARTNRTVRTRLRGVRKVRGVRLLKNFYSEIMKTCKELNQSIKISEYLKARGIHPSKRYKGYSMYCSPFREERSPSFKVSDEKNLWIDYGTGEGGTLIDLVLKMFPHLSVSQAMMEIETEMDTDSAFSFQLPIRSLESNGARDLGEASGIDVYKIQELGLNYALMDYLRSRGIQLRTAKKYCKEVYFKVGDKQFFGIGTENENGWAIRNKFWKGCSGQGISHFKRDHGQLAVFEGVFDLLSYLELEKEQNLSQDFMVLNSLVNIRKSMDILNSYDSVVLLLDRDGGGRKATVELMGTLSKCHDLSVRYQHHKDLNDYWMSRQVQPMRKVGRSK